VIFDGVLHNRIELIQVLADARDEDDNARLVLRAYERWGRDALKRIKGIYAVAIWDGGEHVGILARDPIGLSPLFYAECGDEIYFSTSIDQVLQCDGVSNTLNRAALADHLFDQWLDPGETYFEAVRRVPACHALLVEGGTPRLDRYWDPAPPGEEVNWVTEDELEQFVDLFDQAVNRCLALGPTSIFLSGGLDSVSVAGVAADNSRRQGLPDPLALSLVFPHPEVNEELTQRAVARGLGLEQVLINLDDAIGEKGLLLSACEFQVGKPSPMLNYFTVAYDKLRRRRARSRLPRRAHRERRRRVADRQPLCRRGSHSVVRLPWAREAHACRAPLLQHLLAADLAQRVAVRREPAVEGEVGVRPSVPLRPGCSRDIAAV
jgi:hypothetical protein